MSQQPEGLGIPGSGPTFGPPAGYGPSYLPASGGQPSYLPDAAASTAAAGVSPSATGVIATGAGSGQVRDHHIQPFSPDQPVQPVRPGAPMAQPAQPMTRPGAPVIQQPPSPLVQPATQPGMPPSQPGTARAQSDLSQGEASQPYPPAGVNFPAPDPAQLGDQQNPNVREQVGRGLLYATAAIVVGSVLSVLLLQAGFISSLVAFLMAWGGARLYQVGAGRPAREGAVPLVILLAVGVIVCWEVSLGYALHRQVVEELGPDVALGTTVEIMGSAEFQVDSLRHGLVFMLLGALGIFGTVRGLLTRRG